MLDAGSGGSTDDTTDDDTTTWDGIAYNFPDTDTSTDTSDDGGDLWDSTETTGSTDYTDDVGDTSTDTTTTDTTTTDDSDSSIEYTGGVDTGLVPSTSDTAGDDPVNPSASPDTTDREAMTQEADERQDLIDRVQSDLDVQDTAENAADAVQDRASGVVDWLKDNPKKAAAAGVVVALAAGEA